PALIAGLGEPPSAQSEPAAQERKDIGGVDPAARRSGVPAANRDDLRGRSLDRPNFARAAGPYGRTGRQPSGAADRDVSPGVPTALDRPAAGDDASAQSPRTTRPEGFGGRDHRWQGIAG